MSAGELGAYASHYALWSWFVRSDYRQLLVLEDDVLVDWDYLAALTAHDLRVVGIDFLRLYALSPGLWRPKGRLEGRQVLQYLTYVYGAQAYVLTQAGARRLIEHARVVRRPVDDELDRSWAHGVPNLCVYPFPVIERYAPSIIGDLEAGEPEAGISGLRVARVLQSLGEKARRAAFLARHGAALIAPLRPDPERRIKRTL